MSKVAILKTSPETIVQDYSRLLEISDFKKVIKKDYQTILKLNLSWTLFYPACSSPPWQLDGVANFLKKNDYEDVIAVENKTVVTKPVKGAVNNKWLSVLNKYKIKFQPLTNVKWVSFKPKAEMLALNKIFEDYKIPEMFLNTNVVHFPTIKTHGHTTMTGAMKNAFGGLITERRHHCHKHIHEVLVDLLQIQKEIHKSVFAVMDGAVAGNGAGPRTMTPVITNLILASDDQVAIDAVSARIMGFNPMSIKFIELSHDLGLGTGDLNQIEIIGDYNSIKKLPNYKFHTKKSLVITSDQLTRKGALSFIEPFLYHGPLFNLCIAGSEIYHDLFWYNLVGKKRIKEFMNTKWGQKFKSY